MDTQEMKTKIFKQRMQEAKTLDPQSQKPRPDLDAAAIARAYPNWHQAWHGMVMQRKFW